LARPPLEPRTELAVRLCAVRQALDFKERKAFAAHLGIHERTLGNYETGQYEPPASVLALYKNLGVSGDWILTGEGEMFIDAPIAVRTVDIDIIAEIGVRLNEALTVLGKDPLETNTAALAAEIYNELLTIKTDFADKEQVGHAIMFQLARLRPRLLDLPNDPNAAMA